MSTTQAIALAAGTLTALAVAAPVGAYPNALEPVTAVPTERVTSRMDVSNQAGWWKPLDVHGGRMYLAYNGMRVGPRHKVIVASRRLAGGSWRRACLKWPGDRRCALFRDDIGHNQPTITVDGRGFIHVWASMHHSRWHYWRSRHARWVKTMRFRSGELPHRRALFTYPVATRAPNGDLWLIARQSGLDPVRGNLYRWRAAIGRWYSYGKFAAATGRGVYPDDLRVSGDGRVHLLWSWSGGPAGGVKHAASYMVFDPRTRSYANAAGDPVAAPATPESPVVLQPLEDGEAWTDVMTGYGQRGAKLALVPATGWPLVVYRYQAPADGSSAVIVDEAKIRLAEWDGASWQRQDIYDGRSGEGLGISVHNGVAQVYFDAPASYPGAPTIQVGDQRWSVAAGTLAVLQVGDVDYVYRVDPAQRALHVGARRFVP